MLYLFVKMLGSGFPNPNIYYRTNITFLAPGLEYSLDSIAEFQSDEQSEWWRASLFAFYPQLDREKHDALSAGARREYLRSVLGEVYAGAAEQLAAKQLTYQAHWNTHRAHIEAALGDAFGVDTAVLFNDLTANITLNPICPRYLSEHSFDVFWLNSERGALGMSLHELIHFVWFYVWNRTFGDDPSEYESPSLKWVFSEMAVDAVMRDERLASINPYAQDGCAYEYFYDMRIDGNPILDTMYAMYAKLPINEFMKQGFLFCQNHESEIRKQMK